jgi:hypothetical protein
MTVQACQDTGVRLGRWLLVINCGAAFFFAGCWVYAASVASIGGPARVTDLDRAGVIDKEKLRQSYPELAEDVRNNVGRWIQKAERDAAVRFAQCGIILASVNALGLYISRKRVARKSQPGESLVARARQVG